MERVILVYTLKLGVWIRVFADHTRKTNAIQMRPRSLHAVRRFTRVYLHAKTAVDAGDMRIWRTVVILITGKTRRPPIWAPCRNKNDSRSGISRVYLWLNPSLSCDTYSGAVMWQIRNQACLKHVSTIRWYIPMLSVIVGFSYSCQFIKSFRPFHSFWEEEDLSRRSIQAFQKDTIIISWLFSFKVIQSTVCSGIPLKLLCLFSSILVHHKFFCQVPNQYRSFMTFGNKIQAKTFTWPDMSFYAR